jgi:hypothetical protein
MYTERPRSTVESIRGKARGLVSRESRILTIVIILLQVPTSSRVPPRVLRRMRRSVRLGFCIPWISNTKDCNYALLDGYTQTLPGPPRLENEIDNTSGKARVLSPVDLKYKR